MTALLILVPLAVLFLVNLFFKPMKKAAFWLTLAVVLLQSLLVAFGHSEVWQQTFSPLERFFQFHLIMDNLSILLLLTIGIVTICALIVGDYTIKDEDKHFNFTNLILLLLAGMNGVVIAADVFTLYIFLEITAVSSFILIAMNKDRDALEGAFKYIVLSAVATVLMLGAIGLLFVLAGDTSFTGIREALANQDGSGLVAAAIAIFLGGLFIKGGLIPFHGWLPDAYASAPSPVSVMLAGIVTKVTGVYSLIRLVVSVFGFSPNLQQVLLLIGAATIVFGALAALGQKDFKRLLAYSSISQVGYIIISLGAGNDLGFAGAVFHLFNHAIFKTQLFINAAAVEEQTGSRDMDTMGGLSAKMPVTGFTSTIAALSTSGIPPFAGFWSKLLIIVALWQSGNVGYAFIAVLASVVTLGYFLSMQKRVFFGKLAPAFENIREASFGLVFPAVILTLITVLVGLFFPYFLNTILIPVGRIIGLN